MSGANTAGIAASTAAVYAAQVDALRAMGTVVKVEPEVLQDLLRRAEQPLVVIAQSSGFFSGTYHEYLLPYRGLTFYARSPMPLDVPSKAEVVRAQKVALPSL